VSLRRDQWLRRCTTSAAMPCSWCWCRRCRPTRTASTPRRRRCATASRSAPRPPRCVTSSTNSKPRPISVWDKWRPERRRRRGWSVRAGRRSGTFSGRHLLHTGAAPRPVSHDCVVVNRRTVCRLPARAPHRVAAGFGVLAVRARRHRPALRALSRPAGAALRGSRTGRADRGGARVLSVSAPAPAPPGPRAPPAALLAHHPLRAIIGLAAPTTAVMLMAALSNVLYTYFVSRLGDDAIAAVALVFPIALIMITVVSGGLGTGVAAGIARALGAGRPADACAVAEHAFVITALVSIAGIVATELG